MNLNILNKYIYSLGIIPIFVVPDVSFDKKVVVICSKSNYYHLQYSPLLYSYNRSCGTVPLFHIFNGLKYFTADFLCVLSQFMYFFAYSIEKFSK